MCTPYRSDLPRRSELLQGADTPEELQARIEELSGYLVRDLSEAWALQMRG